MHSLVVTGTLLLLTAGASAQKAGSPPAKGPGIDAYHYTITKNSTAAHGAVVSAHPLASLAGLEMLRKGGNAVDAAIATQWALAVVYPGAGNIGGGGFMVARLAGNKEIALDYREMAPSRAHRDMYLDSKGNAIADKSLNGHLASGVPGTVAGLFAAHQYARLPMKVLIQPAIDFAEKGFVITAAEAHGLNANREDFEHFSTRPVAFVKNGPWQQGDTLIQKELAATLKRIQAYGQQGFYEGKTARLIVEEMQRGGGIITLEDLKAYKAKFRQPLNFSYRGYNIIGMPMPSSGGLLLNQMLKMIEPYNIGAMGFATPASVQLMTEAERRAYADRARYMGDADFVKVPVKALTSEAYLKNRMKDYDPQKAGNSRQTVEGVVPGYESEETTHLSVLDKEGNAVAVTTTLNNGYGSRTVVGGAGFLLNDEMDDFSAKPGSPNLFGAVGGTANAIAPGKRMLSSMAPTIVLKNRKPFLVAGTPGGTTIPTSVFQTIVNIIDFNMTLDDAVNKPKFHHQWLPDRIDIENGFPESTSDALKKMGYQLYDRKQIGRTEVIKVMPGGKLEAVADHRGDDSAAGF
ncbi:gamma-glutamyltransferase [Niabella drilacis]|uniref:Glutathione hydrolase proenzyme n=1 Tax=Niabella drilacis (strain DSM 25811 / CCM 8410 / CCUG 62505 / LMG 26954 / E90) TaxID=1285928 RepID=A0A1G6TVP9_NIADE|nr:gamma-glutamyltransferase [Niabella drilacis]SDD33111.1 gamma-glutamyltranspeptidase / glutathione hydrolase [Niabella drilacis]